MAQLVTHGVFALLVQLVVQPDQLDLFHRTVPLFLSRPTPALNTKIPVSTFDLVLSAHSIPVAARAIL